MKANRYAYLLVGIAVVIGAYGALVVPDAGFCTDYSILTMTLPQEEGFGTNPKLVMEAEFPPVPDTLGIYSMKAPDVNQGYVRERANVLATKGEVQDQGASYVVLTENEYLSVEKASGAETLVTDYKTAYQDLEKGLPGAEVLKRNADAYTTRNKLFTREYQYSGMSYLTRQQVGEGGPQGRPENMMGIAKYSRTLEGLPVEGAGSTITVLLGDGGEVQGHTRVSRDIGERIAVASLKEPGTSAMRTFELLSPEDAFVLLQERGLSTEVADLDEAVVTKMYLAYYESEGSERQDETEPIYVFSGYATGPDGRIEFQEYMYALKDKAGRAPLVKPDRSKAINREQVEVPDKGSKDEGERQQLVLIAQPLPRPTPTTPPLKEVDFTPRLNLLG